MLIPAHPYQKAPTLLFFIWQKKNCVVKKLIQVRKRPEVVKNWYGPKIAVETWTFADLFDRFSSGAVDKTAPLKDMDKYTLNVNIGQKKTELTHLMC